ncbi:MAG: hypothetical protein R3E87_13825 [Burkholderiaceae bacterium]
MPMPIPAAALAAFAALMQPPVATSYDDAAWRIVERTTTDTGTRLNGVREVASFVGCMELAQSEGERLTLGESIAISSQEMTRVRFARTEVSFTCVQSAPATVTMAVNGPEGLLRSAGYRFSWE